jgi:hypothetical protein
MTEQATQIRQVGATMLGSVQRAPAWTGLMTKELGHLLATYRDGLNSNSPLYQALSFYKIIEGVAALNARREHAAVNASPVALRPTPPILTRKVIPADVAQVPDVTEWQRVVFTPYLGKTFAEVRTEVEGTIRNAVAHLTPGGDTLVADQFEDIDACRAVTPVLRYMARDLISEELATPV